MAATLASVPEVRFAAAGALVLPVAVLCHRCGVGVAPAVALEGALCVLVAITLPWLYAAGLGLSAWACVTGFVVNDLGRLTFDHLDLYRLVVLTAGSALVARSGRGGASIPAGGRRRTSAHPSRVASASPRLRPDR